MTNGAQVLISSQLAESFTPTYFGDLGRFFANPDPASAEEVADRGAPAAFCTRRCGSRDGGDENIAAVVCDSPSGAFAQLTDPSGARHIAIGGASINPSSLDAVWGGAPRHALSLPMVGGQMAGDSALYRA
ncbi:MAG: hypothetical protein MZV65_27780 [Chromatiales bacterium]|nr:hypothetical protein [Chromatiales bacterium]